MTDAINWPEKSRELHNHHANTNQKWHDALNETSGRVKPPPDDIRQYWQDWIDRDRHPFWPFWENVRSWRQIRNLPNVLLVHFTKLKQNMPAEIRCVAAIRTRILFV